MTKFSSFVVFAFGIVILVVIVFTMVSRIAETRQEKAQRLGAVRTEVVPCDLPPLSLGTQDQFNQHLDKLFGTGGMSAIRDYVNKEFVPGRTFTIPATSVGDRPFTYILVDREIRRCSSEGVIMMDVPPPLPRLVANMKLGNDAQIEHWSREASHDPFRLTVWWVRVNTQ
jgi:hypothetical protein